MEEIIVLIHIIEFLKRGDTDYKYVYEKLDKFPNVKEKYPNIDWFFLNDLAKTSLEERKKWADICAKTVHIL